MLMQNRGGNGLKENNLNASLSQQIWIAPVSKASPSTELRDWLNWSCCSKYRPWCGWDLCRASWESVPNKIPVNGLNIPNQHFGKLTLQVWYNVFAIIGFFRLFFAKWNEAKLAQLNTWRQCFHWSASYKLK